MLNFDVVIVGAGQGGASLAILLRQQGFSGSIAVVGQEPEIPYERPPLSKEYLLAEKPFEKLRIRPADYWQEQGVSLVLNCEITAVDPENRSMRAADGTEIGYGELVWATGGGLRRLVCGGADLAGVHGIRDRADVDAIQNELPQVQRVAVVGGGYIGLEAASAFRKLGKEVLLLELLPRILARVAGEEIAAFFTDEHRRQGVDLRTGICVDGIAGNGRVEAVHLSDGSLEAVDMVIAGIGIVPAVAPLAAAGAKCSNGVEIDQFCRTSLDHVWAIGDCAAHANRFAGGSVIRLESVQNANDQAAVVARAICGDPQPYTALPWFWSNQYDLKLQTVGLWTESDRTVVRGDPGTRSFSVIYLKDNRVVALDCVNAVKDYVQGRKLVEAGAQVVDPAALADTGVALKDVRLN